MLHNTRTPSISKVDARIFRAELSLSEAEVRNLKAQLFGPKLERNGHPFVMNVTTAGVMEESGRNVAADEMVEKAVESQAVQLELAR